MADDSKEEGGERKFDPKEWEKAYQRAGDLPPEETESEDKPVDFTDSEQTRDFLQGVMDEAGVQGTLMNAREAQDFWKQKERNLENLIAAEMGEDTVVKMVSEDGKEHFVDIGKNKHSWEVYKNIVKGYKIKGDEASIYMLMEVFPDMQSQLRAELEEELEEVKANPRYEGYDTTFGRLKDVVRGHQFDLLPGAVDFRDYEKDGGIDQEGVANALFEKLGSRAEIYTDDWERLN